MSVKGSMLQACLTLFVLVSIEVLETGMLVYLTPAKIPLWLNELRKSDHLQGRKLGKSCLNIDMVFHSFLLLLTRPLAIQKMGSCKREQLLLLAGNWFIRETLKSWKGF